MGGGGGGEGHLGMLNQDGLIILVHDWCILYTRKNRTACQQDVFALLVPSC